MEVVSHKDIVPLGGRLMKRQKDMTLKDEPPRSVGVQYDLVYARKLSLLYLVMTAQADQYL